MYNDKQRINRDGIINYMREYSTKRFFDPKKPLKYKIKCLKPNMIKQSVNNENIKPGDVITLNGVNEDDILLKMVDFYYYNFAWCEGEKKDQPVDILGNYSWNDYDFLSEIYDNIIVIALYTYKIRDQTYLVHTNPFFCYKDEKSLFGDIVEANRIF